MAKDSQHERCYVAAARERTVRRTRYRSPSSFKGKLYRDGVPKPDVYLAQRVKVVFVFREPSMGDDPWEVDLRQQINDEEMRAFSDDTYRKAQSIRGFWNGKVARMAHATLGALAGRSPSEAFAEFQERLRHKQRSHDVLYPFGFMQIKKVGGGSVAKGEVVEAHARDYGDILKRQIALYEPHIVIACGLGGRSPARLLRNYVLTDSAVERPAHGLNWWRFSATNRPMALLEFSHPSSRGSHEELYRALAAASGTSP